MQNTMASARRLGRLLALARVTVVILLAKVLATIVLEYRWYFPANFDAAFLVGRRDSFAGLYAVAFYTHILSGPPTLLLGAFLMLSGKRQRFLALHRLGGRVKVFLILAALVPSGLVMAAWSLAGPIATTGFMALALATAASAVATVYYACAGRIVQHEQWARRCFVLLISPLILRLAMGTLIVLQFESLWAYRLNAWLSWLAPLVIYEVWQRRSSYKKLPAAQPGQVVVTESTNHECPQPTG